MSDAHAQGRPRLQVQGAVARIRLARPERRHALRPADVHWLLERFAALDADPALRVVVIEAEPAGAPDRPVFCAGYDLSGFDDGAHDERLFERMVDALELLRPVTVCALSGSVYGGATDLMLACDLRVALRGAVLQMPATGLGLHYYAGGLRRYVSRLGAELTRRAFLAGRALTVDELQAGAALFDAVTGPEGFGAAVESLVARVAALAPQAAQLGKVSIRELSTGDFDLARLREREALTLRSADFIEGRRALAERRPPIFQGH